ncbi:Ctr2 [Kluyveromyces lactis]|uniref:Copper transport protein n=1 Tax=Kluyveromyces lactis (strain ATCC 8585 / CBS 2359 / DSM 70799 / NBRC 1267 / NRRL Y-1140 / WM37) TaxID=284590 RepID=Q6CXD6_KLULA|nr:uncharacterized protein KLLA0_A09207g [Kluyveromyces lactis]QEU58623.1 Ctr2 [Kluyveromyces lactis]CAH02991.1 KLLA0A09207p [Kluyveromyces lactis]|eukprot:XP_451403.1 uncharacterized protein KLLA0_A09207g [Kluyveromyces lactis]
MSSHHHPAEPETGMCSMDMTFNWNTENVCVVFKSWSINSHSQLLFSCLAIFLLSYGYEYLKHHIRLVNQNLSGTLSRRNRVQSSLWYGLQYSISILLMLIYMTYNGYLIAAVLLGAMFGNFHWAQSPAVQLLPCH